MNRSVADVLRAALWRLRPCWLDDGEALSMVRRGSGPAAVVLARGQLTFSAFALGPLVRLRGRSLRSALRLRARGEQPQGEVGAYAAVRGDTVALWTWQRQALDARLRAAGIDPRAVTPVPETLLAPPRPDGLHLSRCRHGWVQEHWRDGLPRISRWTVARPAPEQCRSFARQAGLEAVTPFTLHEAPVDLTAAVSWSRNVLQAGPALSARSIEAAALAAGLIGCCGTLGWFAATQVALERAHQSAQAEIVALKASAGDILAAEAHALQSRASADAIAAGLGSRPWLALLDALAPALVSAGLVVEEFAGNGNDLRIAVSHARSAPSPVAVVKALEATGGLTQVRVVPGADAQRLAVTARLLADRPRGG